MSTFLEIVHDTETPARSPLPPPVCDARLRPAADSLSPVFPAQRPPGRSPRRPFGAGGGEQYLVSRRFGPGKTRPHRLCPPLRAFDVRRVGPCALRQV